MYEFQSLGNFDKITIAKKIKKIKQFRIKTIMCKNLKIVLVIIF